jgi:hypothetical protein
MRLGTGPGAINETSLSGIEGVSKELGERLAGLVAQLDRLRFAPVSPDREEVELAAKEARQMLRDMDKEWKA